MQVTKLENIDKSVYDEINLFFDYVGKESENTKKAYINDISLYFSTVKDKSWKHITESDLPVDKRDIINYQLFLMDKYKESTVNRKLASVRSLYNFLSDYFDVDDSPFMIRKAKEKKSKKRKVLTYDEYLFILEKAKEQPNGFEKAFLFELAYTTSIRLDALLSLSRDNFSIVDGVHLISVTDKGMLNEKPLHSSIYKTCERLMEKNNGKLFTVSATTAKETLLKIKREHDMDDNISFHSFKKGGMKHTYDLTGDITSVQKQGNHKDARTSLKYYMDFDNDLKSYGSYLISDELDLSVFDDLSKDELISVIRQSDLSTQAKLVRIVGGGK